MRLKLEIERAWYSECNRLCTHNNEVSIKLIYMMTFMQIHTYTHVHVYVYTQRGDMIYVWLHLCWHSHICQSSWCLCFVNMFIHTYTYTCAYVYTQLIDMCVVIRTYINLHDAFVLYTCSYTHVHICVRMYTRKDEASPIFIHMCVIIRIFINLHNVFLLSLWP